MNLNLISLLSFLVTFQLLFLGVFLFTHKKGNRRNNIMFSVLFLLIAWNMGHLTLQMNDINLKWKLLNYIDDGFFLLYGPIIYLYTKGVIYNDFNPSGKTLLHLIPYLLLTVSLFLLGSLAPNQPEELIKHGANWKYYLIGLGMYMHLFAYLWFSQKALREYNQIIKNRFSEIDKINLNWLSFTIKTFVLITIVSLIQNFVSIAKNEFLFVFALLLLLVFIFYFVNKVILKALRQPEIFAGISENEKRKYQGSNLQSAQIEDYRNRLSHLLETEKPYLNPQISLADLADKLSIPGKHLSQVINQSFNQSYFDYINSFRIKEVQRILKASNEEKLTILEAMYQAGFNSKSSFNTAFKKETGLTPSQFKKNIEEMRSTS